jgi:hypothetical protein
MNHRSDTDRLLRHWLADGPSTMPDRVVDVVADRAAAVVDDRSAGERRGRVTVASGGRGDGVEAVGDRLAGHERRGDVGALLGGSRGDALVEVEQPVGHRFQPGAPLLQPGLQVERRGAAHGSGRP